MMALARLAERGPAHERETFVDGEVERRQRDLPRSSTLAIESRRTPARSRSSKSAAPDTRRPRERPVAARMQDVEVDEPVDPFGIDPRPVGQLGPAHPAHGVRSPRSSRSAIAASARGPPRPSSPPADVGAERDLEVVRGLHLPLDELRRLPDPVRRDLEHELVVDGEQHPAPEVDPRRPASTRIMPSLNTPAALPWIGALRAILRPMSRTRGFAAWELGDVATATQDRLGESLGGRPRHLAIEVLADRREAREVGVDELLRLVRRDLQTRGRAPTRSSRTRCRS